MQNKLNSLQRVNSRSRELNRSKIPFIYTNFMNSNLVDELEEVITKLKANYSPQEVAEAFKLLIEQETDEVSIKIIYF
jgi:hypothetical protein